MRKTTLDQLPENTQFALILRHAERAPIKTMLRPGDALLTKKGKNDAFNMGHLLSKFSPIELYHSPISRCQETAQFISKGINTIDGSSEVVGSLFELNGPYLIGDWDRVGKKYDEIGRTQFMRQWFNGDFQDDLMPLKQAAEVQLSTLSKQLQKNNHSTVNISHDWNLMILKEYFFNLTHEDTGAPDFLDCMAAYLQNNKIHLLYCEHEKNFSL